MPNQKQLYLQSRLPKCQAKKRDENPSLVHKIKSKHKKNPLILQSQSTNSKPLISSTFCFSKDLRTPTSLSSPKIKNFVLLCKVALTTGEEEQLSKLNSRKEKKRKTKGTLFFPVRISFSTRKGEDYKAYSAQSLIKL